LLLITSSYPSPRRPTKGTFNHDLVTALRGAGDEVRVVVPVPWTDLFRARKTASPIEGVNYATWWYPPRVGHADYHRWMARPILGAVRQATQAWRPELVLGYWTHPDGTVALSAARTLGIPGALLVGGSDVNVLTQDPRRRRIIVDTLRAADRVFAVGDALRQSIIALGVPADHVATFERGIDHELFNPGTPREARNRLQLPLDRPIVMWVGRMVPVKGLDILLKSWVSVSKHHARPLLLLIGDGEERPSLQEQATRFGDAVRFVGSVGHDALPDWYRAADCVVLPSRSEGIPNVLLEGLACGTPFVASAVGGVPALANPESRTVPAEQAAALATALTERIALPPMTHRACVAVIDRRSATADLRRDLRAMLEPADRHTEMSTP
jgi:teichuronic acid biosynthesis glycosyltransferase TuaC